MTGDDVLVNGGFVHRRGLPGVGEDQFHRLADGFLVIRFQKDHLRIGSILDFQFKAQLFSFQTFLIKE